MSIIYPHRTKPPGPVLIDGGEFMYSTAATPNDFMWANATTEALVPGPNYFPSSYVWRKDRFIIDKPFPDGTDQQTAYIDNTLRSVWPTYSSIGYSLFIDFSLASPPAIADEDPAFLHNQIDFGLSQADYLMWLYTESKQTFAVPAGDFTAGMLNIPGASETLRTSIRRAKTNNPSKKLIWDGRNSDSFYRTSPLFLGNNIDYLKTLPFDGVHLQAMASGVETDYASGISYRCFTPQSFSLSDLRTDFAPMDGLDLGSLDTNLVTLTLALLVGNPDYVPILTKIDFFDDDGWNNIFQNLTNLATVAQEVNIKGFDFDNETYADYHAGWDSYFNGTFHGTKTHQEYEVQAKLRGFQTAQAILSVFPNAIIMFSVSPASFIWNDLTYDQSLNTAFYAGVLSYIANL